MLKLLLIMGAIAVGLFLFNYLVFWRHEGTKREIEQTKSRTYEGWDSGHDGGF